MDLLLHFCEWLPRLPPNLQPFQLLDQLPFTLKDLVITLLSATHPIPEPDFATLRLQHKGPSELPYYGRSPPVYPSPIANGTSNNLWATAYHEAHDLVAQMTVDEMVNLTRGFPGPCVGNTGAVPRLAIPSLCFYDGPSGLRGQEFVSAFPAGIHLAATFDKDLMYRYGRALGDEFRGRGVHVALGPVAGPLGRVARGGRNWEGLSNDPYLAGAAMGAVTRGMTDAGVIATPKHWLLNEQEHRRRWSAADGDAISSNVDDRTLHELYAFPFMDALRAGAGGVMCSYQRANHSYACQNSKLLNGILKTELGFEGFVVSDWDGQMSGVASALAGLDLTMPSAGLFGPHLLRAVHNGSVPLPRLADMATRLLAAHHHRRQHLSYPPLTIYPPSPPSRHPPVDVQSDHALLIRRIATAGTVLVKNLNSTLPLLSPRYLAIYGPSATPMLSPWSNPDRFAGDYTASFNRSTLPGTLITGGGSGGTTPPYISSPFSAIQSRLPPNSILRWDLSPPSAHNPNPTPYPNAETCLVFLNAYASESFDRASLTDAASDALVLSVASWCTRTVVILHTAGIRIVGAWSRHPNVTGIIMAGLPGQEAGTAIADVLFGDVNPSGRLPYTIAREERGYGGTLNSTRGEGYFAESWFDEGLWVDYRAFDRDDPEGEGVEYEFGFGLSYTEFGYGGLEVEVVAGMTEEEFPDPGVAVVQGGHPGLWEVVVRVRCVVGNEGAREGAEVVQLYLGVPGAGEDTPVRQLRGVERVGVLKPGEEAGLVFELTRRDVSVWDVGAQQWRMRRGRYEVYVGASSRDFRLRGGFVVG
ncbi:glycoside hydrolase family 3 protein [Schizothecium vesticola]|uniref:Beta-glucosidase cel3A n=1 Tax=Schizothecium vesticola TaxID=314040 RepID=A0AA40K207_9PEZI|nr:glycoside hydrolase family 3 protein [Schizothecium vesticola]